LGSVESKGFLRAVIALVRLLRRFASRNDRMGAVFLAIQPKTVIFWLCQSVIACGSICLTAVIFAPMGQVIFC